MKKKVQKLKLSRETLRQLNPSQLGRLDVRGGDQEPPYTRTLLPTGNPMGCLTSYDCTNAGCADSVTCDSVAIC